jgi:hypothetical protein
VSPALVGQNIIAHVTWWEEEALTHLPLILRAKPPRYSITYGGIDAFNARMTEQKKKLVAFRVLQQQSDTHRRLIDYVQSAPEEQFTRGTRFRRRLRLDTYSHYPKHAKAIRNGEAANGRIRIYERSIVLIEFDFILVLLSHVHLRDPLNTKYAKAFRIFACFVGNIQMRRSRTGTILANR